MPEFEWNDETITNSYGFRVLNKGGDFARFDANPVMQNSHVNTTAMNLGTWKNRKIDGFKLKGTTVFDNAREVVKEVEGQVDRGVIKGCSMGLGLSWDDDSWQKAPDGVWELVKWELMEVSICAIPSNSSALALYDRATGELIAEDQFKLSLQNLSANDLNIKNNPTMDNNKITLSTDAQSVLMKLNIASGDSAAAVSNAIVELNNKLTVSEGKVTELNNKLTEQAKTQAEALVDGAISEERLTAGDRADFVELAIANYSLAAKQIAKMPGKKSLNGSIANPQGGASEIKSKEDFLKAPADKQLAFKTESPEAYQALWKK